jgi:CRISPR/Cas system-associated exonuclease Cas4 (RecB family)
MVQSFLPQTKQRFRPYAWVTTLAQLMADEDPCFFAAWLKTQHQLTLPASNFDSTIHDHMVIERAEALRKLGYDAAIEEENSQKVVGKTFDICIAGRPDIVAYNDEEIIVEDCKSGSKRPFHYYQVLLYMLLIPHASTTKEKFRGRQLKGRLVYPDSIEDVPQSMIDPDFIGQLHDVLKILTSKDVPKPSASDWNCRYCSLAGNYCSIKRCD